MVDTFKPPPIEQDSNEAYAVEKAALRETDSVGSWGIGLGWWSVTFHGAAVRHFPERKDAERYATDAHWRAEIASAETPLWQRGRAGK